MTEDFAGSAYEALIKEQLAEERSRKQSLEQRGLAVVTSSGTMVTLLFAIGAVATKTTAFELPLASKIVFTVALVAFAAAGVFGILTNKPDFYEEVDDEWLKKTLSPIAWNYKNLALARRRTSEARVKSIKSFREKNPKKVDLLTRAIAAEVGAVSLVALGVAILLFS